MDAGEGRLGGRWAAAILGLAALAIGPGLGAARLSYHEAIVAQGAREMAAAGDWLVPTLDGRPWLEKPPLAHWLAGGLGAIGGGVTELATRLPSALAAALACLATATLAARRFGPTIGGLSGCVQATTAWTVARGRLGDADMVLACLVAWVVVGLDALRADPARPKWLARLVLVGVGATALVKGIGFGAALIGAATAAVLLWDRDRPTLRSLLDRPGLLVGAVVALAWPALVLLRHPQALGLWTTHVADRLAERPEVFAGRADWWAYVPSVLGLVLPWTPFALAGMPGSARRAWRDRGGPDRLLWAWAVGPVALLSIASVKNAHYAIHALPPWSIWAALGLARVGERLQARGRSPIRLERRLAAGLVGLSLLYGLTYGLVVPLLDRRGREWAFYEAAGRSAPPDEPLFLLYDDWDRLPYATPFGPLPHDLPVRLYYLNRPASWREGRGAWPDLPAVPFAAIARDRDVEGLARLGRVERVAQGPPVRWDRTYSLFRVTPKAAGDRAVARAPAEGPARR